MKKKEIKTSVYRDLEPSEVELLFAYFDKHNGNMNSMIRDKECPFHSYTQVHHYCVTHGFKEKLVQIRLQNTKEILSSLGDAKIKIIENAMKMMQPRYEILLNKFGAVVYDIDSNPKTVEIFPSHKEIKAAWDIIKTELGEPTTVTNTQHSGLKGKPIELVETNKIIFEDFTDATDSQ